MRAEAAHTTLLVAAWPSFQQNRLIKGLLLAFAGSLLLAMSAKLQIPFWPVPMTMQTFVVLLIGAAFGPRLGVATIALYLLEGAAGLPVFAGTPEKGIGLAYMMGPTGGYLVGYLGAAWIVGTLAQRGWDRTVPTTLAAMLLGTLTLYVPGIIWLTHLIGFEKAIQFGVTPFLFAAAFKIALAAAVLPMVWKVVSRRA